MSDILEKKGGDWILRTYGGSLCSILQIMHPEIEWIPWLFSKVPKGFWFNSLNQKK